MSASRSLPPGACDCHMHVFAVAERLQKLGLDIAGGEPAALTTAQRADMARWAQVIKRGNIHASE